MGPSGAMRSCLLIAGLFLVACTTPGQEARKAALAGDYDRAAALYTQAASESLCPSRGIYMLNRADVEVLAQRPQVARGTVDRAIQACPDLHDAWWTRAQMAQEDGQRDLALEYARQVRDQIPAAAALHAELTAEMDLEQRIRDHATRLTRELKDSLQLEAEDEELEGGAEEMARQVPIPITLEYSVQHRIDKPKRLQLEYRESWSYRGDPAEPGYVLVRSLDVNELDQALPVYFRLAMANQRLPMRFEVDPQGDVLSARWMSNGPERGVRPAMLQPFVEALLKRRRVFAPGQAGRRGPGETWRGETVRIVDGKPITVEFESEAKAWARIHGIKTLHVHSELSAEGYSGSEDRWIHLPTAVEVRSWSKARYPMNDNRGRLDWEEEIRSDLVGISGTL